MTRHLALLVVLATTWTLSDLAAAATAGMVPDPPASAGEIRLREMEGEHARQAADWEEAIHHAATVAERDSLEALVPGRKQAQRREWLTLRLEQERARGDLDKIARLEAELARLTAPPPPPATFFVPRETDSRPVPCPGQGGGK